MRLQQQDLENYCKAMLWKTNKKYSIVCGKGDYWYWKLVLKNNETEVTETITSGLTLREAHEYLRAFYRGLEYSKLLIDNK